MIQANFDSWKKVLISKREFRETDKVCERHFQKHQIITHWNHVIDGKLCQLKRDKPKIQQDAIPLLNLPTNKTYPTAVIKELNPISTKRKAGEKTSKKVEKVNIFSLGIGTLVKNICSYLPQISPKRRKGENNVVSEEVIESYPAIPDDDAPVRESAGKSADEKQQIFESIYDDVCEIDLPSTLWAFHRDPDRKYITFTMFNVEKMASTKILHVTDTLKIRSVVNGSECNIDKLEDIDCGILSRILKDMDSAGE